MPSLETFDRNQYAVLWAATGDSDEFGNPVMSTPVELLVKWERIRKQVVTPKGDVVGSDAMVKVDREIALRSRMWKGRLRDWFSAGSEGDDDEVMEVIVYEEVVDLKGNENFTERWVTLMFSKDVPT